MTIFEQLVRDEGLELFPYRDTAGKLTIGVGRNLDDVGISRDEAMYLLGNDVARTLKLLEQKAPWYLQLDEARRAVVVNMAFNMGVGKLLNHMQTGQHGQAAEEMLRSAWAGQVGDRSVRLARQMAEGVWV